MTKDIESAHKPWKAEYAKSSRSSCRACNKPIVKDAFRLAKVQTAHQFNGVMPVSICNLKHFFMIRRFGERWNMITVWKNHGLYSCLYLCFELHRFSWSPKFAIVSFASRIPETELAKCVGFYSCGIMRVASFRMKMKSSRKYLELNVSSN